MKKFLFMLLLLFISSPVQGLEGFSKPPMNLLSGLLNNPQGLDSKVGVVLRGGNKEWCTIRADYHVVVPVPLETMKAQVTDYESYPKIFPKVRSVTVDRKPEGVYLNQVLVVSVLGFETVNKFTILLTQNQEANPKSIVIRWNQTWADESINDVTGLWYLEEFTVSGKPFTYARYQTRSEVPKNIIGQDGIMGMFMDGEIKDLLNTVSRLAQKR